MIPTATRAVRTLLGETFDKCESSSLRIEKFVVLADKDRKKEEIDRICACVGKHAASSLFRYSQLPGAISVVMKLQSRLIINQAGGILENAGLALHPHFGCPMIPGSAAKGVARAATIQAICDVESAGMKSDLLVKAALTFGWCSEDWSEKTSKKGNTFRSDFRYAAGEAWRETWEMTATRLHDVIGTRGIALSRGRKSTWERLPDFAGLASFLPAYPMPDCPLRLVADLVNCHHPKYYHQGGGDNAPDTENPIPNFFPAVEAGLSFEFVVVPVRHAMTARIGKAIPGFSPVRFAFDRLQEGLSTRGAGAKTNAGYGWFEKDEAGDQKLAKVMVDIKATSERATLVPDKSVQSEFAAMKPDQLAGRINEFAFPDPKLWPPNRNDRYRLSLLDFCTIAKPEVWQDAKSKPKGKAFKALSNLASEFKRSLP